MSHPTSLFPPYVGVLLSIVVLALAAWGIWRYRVLSARRAWRAVAEQLGGTLETDRTRMRVKGRYRGYAAFLQEAVSHEDAIPYPHTRGALNVKNPPTVVMGLRRKSLLEELTTRKEARPVETGDRDFDRAFFLLLTVPEHAEALLPRHVRRALMKYSDVEVYLRSSQIEWRRAGTVRSEREIMALFETLADIAGALEALPARSISLEQKRADEALVEQGL